MNTFKRDPYSRLFLFLVFFGLYTIQGFIYGYTTYIDLHLNLSKVDYWKIALFQVSAFPGYLKFFTGPVVDTYFLKSLGKRMSYILPCTVLVCSLLLFLSLQIQELVTQGNIFVLLPLFFVLNLTVGVQDVAIDSLVEETYLPEHVHDGINAQNFGQMFAILVSVNLQIQVEGSLSNSRVVFLLLTVFLVFSFTALAFAFIREKEEEKTWSSPFQIFKLLPNFVKNPNLLVYTRFVILFGFSKVLLANASQAILLRNEFPAPWMSQISFYHTIITSLFLIAFKNFDYFKNRIKVLRYVFYSRVVFFLYFILVVVLQINYKASNLNFYLLLFQFPFAVMNNVDFMTRVSINFHIADEKCTATHLGLLNSLCNFPELFFKPVSSTIMEFFGLNGVIAACIGFYAMFYPVLNKSLADFPKRTRADYQISD